MAIPLRDRFLLVWSVHEVVCDVGQVGPAGAPPLRGNQHTAASLGLKRQGRPGVVHVAADLFLEVGRLPPQAHVDERRPALINLPGDPGVLLRALNAAEELGNQAGAVLDNRTLGPVLEELLLLALSDAPLDENDPHPPSPSCVTLPTTDRDACLALATFAALPPLTLSACTSVSERSLRARVRAFRS